MSILGKTLIKAANESRAIARGEGDASGILRAQMQQNGDEHYREFERALTDVITEQEYALARRTSVGACTGVGGQERSTILEAVESAFSHLD